jgi:hypothetical protein
LVVIVRAPGSVTSVATPAATRLMSVLTLDFHEST